MIHDPISLRRVTEDETRRGSRVAAALRNRSRHTRATVAEQLARPAGDPPLYAQTAAALKEADR